MSDKITEHTFYSPLFGHVDKFTGTRAEYNAHFADLIEKRKLADQTVCPVFTKMMLGLHYDAKKRIAKNID